MDHAAVPAALVRADPILFLEDHDSEIGKATERRQGGREPDDAAADDRERTARGGRTSSLDFGLGKGDQKSGSSTGLPSLPLGGGGGT